MTVVLSGAAVCFDQEALDESESEFEEDASEECECECE